MKKIKLKEVLDVRRGASLSGEYYSESGNRIRLTLGNFAYPRGGFKENTSKSDIYFTGTVAKEYILKKGDIITPLTEQVRGLLGETATIPQDDLYIQSGDVGLIIPNEHVIDKRFSFYLVSSPVVKAQLDAGSQQTKIRHTSPDAIKDCIAWIPNTTTEQSRIAKLLDSLNAKIANNNAIAADLEAIAKLIYDYWFVQFDFPDENGKPYKSSGGKMVWNDELKREVPDGWDVKCVSDLAICNECSLSQEAQLSSIEYLDTTNLTENRVSEIKHLTSEEGYPSRAKRIVTNKDILFSTVRPNQHHYGIIMKPIRNLIASTGFAVLTSKGDRDNNIWLYLGITSDGILNALENIANSSVSSYPSINPEDVLNIMLPIPKESCLLKRFAAICNELFEEVDCLQKENEQIISLRDFLLPMLMNGQVTVKS